MNTDINLPLIKKEYIQGQRNNKNIHQHPTLKELSQKYNCSYASLRKIAAKEHWTQEKNIYRTKVHKALNKNIHDINSSEINSLAQASARFNSAYLTLADKGLDLISICMDGPMNSLDFLRISNAALNFQQIGRLALDEPTTNVVADENINLGFKEMPVEFREDLSQLFGAWDKKTVKSS